MAGKACLVSARARQAAITKEAFSESTVAKKVTILKAVINGDQKIMRLSGVLTVPTVPMEMTLTLSSGGRDG